MIQFIKKIFNKIFNKINEIDQSRIIHQSELNGTISFKNGDSCYTKKDFAKVIRDYNECIDKQIN